MVGVGRGKQALLLFFSSSRSGPCRRMESVLAQVGRKQRQRLRIVRVDVGEREDVASHFQVTSVPTLVLVRDNRVVARLEGRSSATRIEALLDAHLADAAVLA